MHPSNHARRLAVRARVRRFFHPHVERLEDRLVPDAGFGSLVNTGIYDPGHLLVQFQPGVKPESVLPTGASVVEKLPLVSDLYVINLGADRTISEVLSLLASNPNVRLAQPDFQVSVGQVPNDANFNLQWGQMNTVTPSADISAPAAWDMTTGTRQTIVAVIDTGVDYNHPDLAANIWTNSGEVAGNGVDDDGNGYVDDLHGYDFANYDANPMDDHSHGTHVAGIIGAVGNNGVGVAGVNWNVQIMALKFMSASGSGSTSAAIQALNYAVMMGANISNNSWGGGGYNQALYDAINNARSQGHIFVAAAGNTSSNNDVTPFYPANYALDNIVAVAATTSNDGIAGYSNYGATSVDLGAPGDSIYSTLPGGGYGYKSGTSMAAPFVAGALSLVWDFHPTWTYNQVINAVLGSVDPLASLNGKTATGGRLNLLNALGSVAPPSLSINNVSLSEGNSGAVTSYTFNVTLSAASTQTVTVNWGTANGSAVAGSDYTAANGTLTFNPGETSKTITVNVNGDDVFESTETFLVQLSGATNAVVAGGGTGAVINDDVAPMPVVGINDASVNEGNSGFSQITFTLTLSAASPAATSVRWTTVAGSALASADFTSASGTVTFNPGELSKTIKVKVKGDRVAEPNENFTIVLSSPSNLTIGRGQGTGAIVNDDGGMFNSIRTTGVSSLRLADLFRALGNFDMDWLAPSWKRKR